MSKLFILLIALIGVVILVTIKRVYVSNENNKSASIIEMMSFLFACIFLVTGFILLIAYFLEEHIRDNKEAYYYLISSISCLSYSFLCFVTRKVLQYLRISNFLIADILEKKESSE